jgi:hypothetical protein
MAVSVGMAVSVAVAVAVATGVSVAVAVAVTVGMAVAVEVATTVWVGVVVSVVVTTGAFGSVVGSSLTDPPPAVTVKGSEALRETPITLPMTLCWPSEAPAGTVTTCEARPLEAIVRVVRTRYAVPVSYHRTSTRSPAA